MTKRSAHRIRRAADVTDGAETATGARHRGHEAEMPARAEHLAVIPGAPEMSTGAGHRKDAGTRFRPGPVRTGNGVIPPKISRRGRLDRASRRTSTPANSHRRYVGS